MVKITVVTPCLNQIDTIETAILSVLDQGYENLEFIVIDGGSTDGTLDIIKKYESRLSFWCSEPDEGRYDAVNKGFARSTGEVMACLNANDFYLPGALGTVSSVFETLPVDWLTSLAHVAADRGGSCIDVHRIAGFSREAFLDGAHFPESGRRYLGSIRFESTFWRRSLWDTSGPMNPGCRFAGEYDLWARFFRTCNWLYCSACPLASFRYSDPERRHSNYPEFLSEGQRALENLRRDLNWRPRRIREAALKLGLANIPYIRFLPYRFYKWLYTLYQYEARLVVRRKRGIPTPSWEIRSYPFLSWALGDVTPHYAD